MKLRSLITSAAALALSVAVRPDRKLPKHRAPAKPVTFVRPAVFAEVAPVEAKTPAPLAVEDIKGQVPQVAVIEKAARDYDQARLDLNTATRRKNKAAKTLAETPDGTYGLVTVERFASTRQVPDLDAIKALLAEHGLGDMPMKTCAASLQLTFAHEDALADEQLLVAA